MAGCSMKVGAMLELCNVFNLGLTDVLLLSNATDCYRMFWRAVAIFAAQLARTHS